MTRIHQSDGSWCEKAVSIVIPTYRRERILCETILNLKALSDGVAEILVIDQTPKHEPETDGMLADFEREGAIRRFLLERPSITHAMNVGLKQARNEIVLFLDDDIIPHPYLIKAHAIAHRDQECNIVAGQILQPGEEPLAEDDVSGEFRFCSSRRCEIREVMGGNFSVKRETALRLGGFDENFVHVAYRFEAEFCDRAIAAGERILFEPKASIRHLKVSAGGTRSFGSHLTTIKPSHAVGAYYYFLRGKRVRGRILQMLARPLRAVRTKHHLRNPWWIPLTIFSEIAGLIWAIALYARGPRLIDRCDLEAGKP